MLRVALYKDSPRGKEQCIEHVKGLGEYIQNNAEDLVGDISNVTSIKFTFEIGVDMPSVVTAEKKRYIDFADGD